MISRMILVGLVAVLGVSLPSRSESGGWWTSAHAWAIAQIAEWDMDTPGEDLCSIVTEAPDSSPREATQPATRTNTTALVAIEPIPVDDDLCTGLADELNRMSEDLDIPATSTAIAESPTDFVAVLPGDSIELKLVAELCRIVENSARDETVSTPATPQPCKANADPAIDEIFADISEVFAPSEPEPASISQQPRAADAIAAIDELFADGPSVFAPPESEPVSIAQSNPVLIAAGTKSEPISSLEDTASPSRQLRTPTFEPIKVPADLESGVADELNRASEGLDIVPPEIRTLGDARPPISGSEPGHAEGNGNHGHASIGKALSLTRDAAFAWMNVLTGMAPVHDDRAIE